MNENKLQVGRVYFHIGRICEPHHSGMISTFVYEGVVEKDCSSTSCDVPFRFHRFIEWNSWLRFEHEPEAGTAGYIREGVDIPSLEQALESMLTWEELKERLPWYG